MASGLASLERMEYPGRLIVVGRLTGGAWVVGYAVTGRSHASRARKLVVGEGGHVYTAPTDEETLRRGNPALLVYPAMMFAPGGIAVSNGTQTRLVDDELARAGAPADVLARAFAAPRVVGGIDVTLYEPDEPNYTPRIAGCVTSLGAALSIVRRGPAGEAVRRVFDASRVQAGAGSLISTYAGPNRNPLPSFDGEPLDVGIGAADARAFAERLYAALGPREGRDDLRVAAVAAEYPDGPRRIHIVNRGDA